MDQDKLQTMSRDNFLQDGKFIYEERTQQNNTNDNHRANITLDHKIDSTNAIRFSTNLNYNATNTDTHTRSQNMTPEQAVLNENMSHSISDGTHHNFKLSPFVQAQVCQKRKKLFNESSIDPFGN